MGLLDSLMGDPQTAGLLGGAAGMADMSGPSLMPHSFGQVMSAGLRGAQAGYTGAQEQQMRQLEMQMKHVSLQQALAKLSAFQQFNDGDAQQGAAVQSQPAIPAPGSMPLGSGMADMAPAQPGDGQQAIAAQSGMGNGGNKIKALQKLALFDGKIGDAYNMQKDMLTGYKVDAGAYRMNPMTGQLEYMPDPNKGITMNNGVAGVIPGYSGANAAIEGAKENAVQQAKNANTPLGLDYVNAGGDRIGGTIGQYLGQNSGPSPSMPQQAAPMQDATSTWKAGKFAPDVLKNLQNMALQGNPDATQMLKSYTQRGQVQQAPAQQPTPTMAYSPQGGSGLQSPAQARAIADAADVAKADQLKKVNLNNDPQIQFQTQLLDKAHAGNQAALEKVHDTVRNEYEIQKRNEIIAPYLDKIKTGGFAAEERINFANALNNSGMVPASLKPSISTFIANGDATSGKVIDNQLASAGIKTMLDTLDKEGKPNMAIFKAVKAAQENIASGNGTLKEIFNIQKMLYDSHYEQEQAMSAKMASKDYNPLTLQADVSKSRKDSLATAPVDSKATSVIDPPKAAINTLRMNPKLASAFDEKYGTGAAAKILGK